MGTPFAQGQVVERGSAAAIPVGPAEPAPEGSGFLDGIQRHAVEGHFGVTPIVRAYVAAGVLVREAGVLRAAAVPLAEEFVIVPLVRLQPAQRAALEQTALPLVDVAADSGASRPHPLLDVFAAVQVVERRREALERRAARIFLADRPGTWLVVDGGLNGIERDSSAEGRVVGVIKSHETQFLDGADLETALTLPCGARSRVFARPRARGSDAVHTWYLRLWPWAEHDLFHGLVRVERAAGGADAETASMISRWMLGERAPIAAPDVRWDRLLYPIHQVETYLRAQAGAWT